MYWRIKSGHSSGGVIGRKRGRAVLILPDFSARVAVLEFEASPQIRKSRCRLSASA